jgi:hypothetical protein
MLAAFAAVEARVNATVMGSLSNRRVIVPDLAVDCLGMFDDAGTVGLDGLVESTQPRLTLSLADAGMLPQDTLLALIHPISLARSVYEVGNSEPDGAGFVVYQLREA